MYLITIFINMYHCQKRISYVIYPYLELSLVLDWMFLYSRYCQYSANISSAHYHNYHLTFFIYLNNWVSLSHGSNHFQQNVYMEKICLLQKLIFNNSFKLLLLMFIILSVMLLKCCLVMPNMRLIIFKVNQNKFTHIYIWDI